MKKNIYVNETAESLKRKGWEMTGNLFKYGMHPDLVRLSELEASLGEHPAYVKCGFEVDGEKITIAYALKKRE